MLRIRKNVNRLRAGDPTLRWFEKALGVMQTKRLADPLGLRFQAAIHRYERSQDPNRSEEDVLPSNADQERYWNQCQHGSWFFLPWHRMYLHVFERIVLNEIVSMGGPPAWALPYWNYSASDYEALLPHRFQCPAKQDGTPNYLYTSERGSNVNENEPFARETDYSLACLGVPEFEGGSGRGGFGFGGVATSFVHTGSSSGAVENCPHGTMHSAVAGGSGRMGNFTKAPLDPIFWLHHCNIDRLWEVWLGRSDTHTNPTSAAWLDGVEFDFFDWNAQPIKLTSRHVLDTRASPLEYEYDDTSDPWRGPTIAEPPPTGVAMAELIGATTAPFWLRGARVEQSIKIMKPTGPAKDSFWIFDPLGVSPVPGRAPRVFVRVEQIKSDTNSVPYDVFLNLSDSSDPGDHKERYAGRLSMFGVVEASRRWNGHVGQGLGYALEVTDILRVIVRDPGWQPDELRVTMVPAKRPEPSPATAEVGRISIYLE